MGKAICYVKECTSLCVVGLGREGEVILHCPLRIVNICVGHCKYCHVVQVHLLHEDIHKITEIHAIEKSCVLKYKMKKIKKKNTFSVL